MTRQLAALFVVAQVFAAPAFAQAETISPVPTDAPAARVVLPDGVAPLRYELSITPDLRRKTFLAHVDIALRFDTPTRVIKLNAAELRFTKAALSDATGSPIVMTDSASQTVTLTFASSVTAGTHRLAIDYSGAINEQAVGLFQVGYDSPGGRRTALFTQFEPGDARRVLPCWDEPNRKAVFQLTVNAPADLMAVSNMPVSNTRDVGGGLRRTAFAETPRMSPYLLFFGLGDFERIHRTVDGVDVGVIFKRGDAAQARYALDAETRILPFYNDYFGLRYPLPKLDLIAGPTQSVSFGAMENWGANFYFERNLLIDAKTATDADRENVFSVVAHETAHQWFGDLVTMDWWDDLWLNEGFAVWMTGKAVSTLHPEWNVAIRAVGGRKAAMRLDAGAGTHPIIGHITDVREAQQAFDEITYSKGAAVITMFEDYVGADVWRTGVRNYMRHHAYGSTTSDDLWREIDTVSPRRLTDVAHDFTREPGVPLISVTPASGGAVRLTQGRFGVDSAALIPER